MCAYNMWGICRFGEFCRFNHDSNDIPVPEQVQEQVQEQEQEQKQEQMPSTSSFSRQRMWANAPVFVPSEKRMSAEEEGSKGSGSLEELYPNKSPCFWGVECPFCVRLELCKLCDLYCLHPRDQDQRREHNRECTRLHEQAMELSFAIDRSRDKMCGICLDTVVEKKGREKRFGILSQCSHIFCLPCIRTWRQAEQFEPKVTRACPECRVCSDFVCPSAFWVDTKEAKDKLLGDYRTALGAKDCKYFKRGLGRCPFGNKCFYKHALPSGQIVDVGLPWRNQKQPTRNQIPNNTRTRLQILLPVDSSDSSYSADEL
ncbi:hypothetical protein M5D96_011659 [Drosophila gunungcola]|uniref:RING-type E3 ubiquitin transferase n=2 Tax=Drosophila gunungcola TaxID=103775 RepID=A0A9P9YF74_9MUSC|nr:hypothetical protein M5D96_011659 [Drosophila gunungcola]